MFSSRHLLFITAISVFIALAGCGQGKPKGIVAPEKPLSQAEQAILNQLEAVPEQDQTSFANKHRAEIVEFATHNRAFGERLNVLMDVKQTTGTK